MTGKILSPVQVGEMGYLQGEFKAYNCAKYTAVKLKKF